MPSPAKVTTNPELQHPHSWCIFHRSQDTWDAMYRDCEQAKTSIEFEQYILENDNLGKRFMELFILKAKEGLKIFLICDMFGSVLLYRSPLVKELRRHGGRMYFFNNIHGWAMLMPWRWFPRDHTKTLLIDSSTAYIGGVCIAERMSHWRDTHMRISGPVVSQIRSAFDELENKILYKKNTAIPPLHKNNLFFYFLSRPRQKQYSVYNEFTRAISNAQHYIYITSAFFITNRRFLELLKKAHDRGVDIRVLVPERSDVLLADYICLSYTKRLFSAGLRIFHYQKNVLHSKTAVIDDSWGTVGSTNFDIISFFHNREANLIINDKEAIAELKSQFFKDLEDSSELTQGSWGNIPLWKKIVGYCARILRVFF